MFVRNLAFLASVHLAAASGPPVQEHSDGQPYDSQHPGPRSSAVYVSHATNAGYSGASSPGSYVPYATETYNSLPSEGAASCTAASNGINTTWWQGWGGNVWNNHWVTNNSNVDVSSAKALTEHCQLNYTGGVSATPTVEGDIIYYPSWNGKMYALNYKTCKIMWETDAAKIAQNFKPVDQHQKKIIDMASRTSAILEGDVVFFGTQIWALALALNKHTGQLLDLMQLNPHPFAVLTTSPTEYDGSQFWGVASKEETAARSFSNVSRRDRCMPREPRH